MNFADISKSISNWFKSPGASSIHVPGVELVALEERVLYSASPFPVDSLHGESVVDVEFDAELFESIDSHLSQLQDAFDSIDKPVLAFPELELLSGSDQASDEVTDIVFIDRSVDDFQTLVDDITARTNSENIRIEFIDVAGDGVAQISKVLNGGRLYETVHLVTHGSDGQLQLGNRFLNADSVGEHAADLSSWNAGLTANADILIYGCEVAATESGEDFVDVLSDLTGADIAASDDLTGHRNAGGDWELEYTAGIVDAEAVFSVRSMDQWNHTLAQVDASAEDNGTTKSIAADANGNTVIAVSSTSSLLVVSGEDIIVTGLSHDFASETFPQFRANTTTDGDQKWASVAAAENGDFIVVWTSKNGSESGVFGRTFYADGSEKRAEFQIDAPGSVGEDASVAMDRFGNFVVAWEVDAGGTLKHDIFAQKFNSSGDKVGGIFGVNEQTDDHQYDADVAVNDQGEFVIAWSDRDTGNVHFQEYSTSGADGANHEIVHSRRIQSATVDINNNGQFVVGYEFRVGVGANIYRADGSFQSVRVDPDGPGVQFNLATGILENGDVAFAWEGVGSENVDTQGVFSSFYKYDSGGDQWNVTTTEAHLQTNSADWSKDQTHVAISTARDEAFVFGFVEDQTSYTVASLASAINQTPESSAGNFHVLENTEAGFDSSNFDYSDQEGDSLAKIAVRTLPSSGVLSFDGVVIDQAAIDASPDGFVIDITDIGKLTYAPAAEMYGINFDSFEYRVHDGSNFSVNNATLQIQVGAEDRFWISTEGNGPAANGLPDYSRSDALQLGGPLFELGADSVGDWSTHFSLSSFGLDLDALHYVEQDTMVGGFQLNRGDILFSISNNSGTLPGDFQVRGVDDKNFNDEDVLVFRPTSSDFSAGVVSVLLDMSSAAGADPLAVFGDLNALTLVERDTVVGGVVVNAGSLLIGRSGGAEHSNIYLVDVIQTGENSTVTSTSMLIDGSDNHVDIDEKIYGLELIEQTTTIGGITLNAGTIVAVVDRQEDVGDDPIDVQPHDVFALDVTSTGEGTSNADATLILDGSDVGLTGASLELDALAILGSPDPSVPPAGTNGIVSLNEDGAFHFDRTDFGYVPSASNNPFVELVVETLPSIGQLIFQGSPVLAGQAIGTELLGDLVFYPGDNLSDSVDFAEFVFRVSDGDSTSNTNTIIIRVTPEAGDIAIETGTELVAIDSWAQVNTTNIGDQSEQHIAALDGGGYVVVWLSEDGDFSDGDDGKQVFYQVFNAAGAKVGTEQLAHTAAPGAQDSPSITALNDGGFVIVWSAEDVADREIFAQRFDADGNRVNHAGDAPGGVFQVNHNAFDAQIRPVVTGLEDGGFVVVWSSYDPAISNDSADVVGRIYESNGTAGSEFLINTINSNVQRPQFVMGLESGGFAVTWTDQGGDGNDIGVRVFDEFGNAIASDAIINTHTAGDQRNPVFHQFDNGELVVVWQTDGVDSDLPAIVARRIGPDGIPFGPEIQLNITEAGGQVRPVVVSLPGDRLMVAWDSASSDGSGRGIVAMEFDSSLSPLTNEIVLNSRTYDNQSSAAIAVLADGDLLVTYLSHDGDNGNGSFGSGIFADRLTPGIVGTEDSAIPLGLSFELTDIDSSEQITQVQLSGVPLGAVLIDRIGNTATGDGNDIDVTGWVYDSIKITPPPESIADFDLSVRVTTEDTDGSVTDVQETSRDIRVIVGFANDTATYNGPTAFTTEDLQVQFTQSQLLDTSSDPDSDSVGAPVLDPDVSFDLDPDSPPTVGGGVLQLSTIDSSGSAVVADFDANHVSFDPEPASNYPAIDAALYFDGLGGGSISGPTSGAGDATMEMWFKPENLTGNHVLFETGSSSNGIGLYLMNGVVEFHLQAPITVDGNPTEPYVLTGNRISATEFNHVMVVIDSGGTTAGDPSEPGIALYVNGVRTDVLADIQTLAPGFTWSDGSPINIGTADGSFAHQTETTIESFRGSIAAISLYDQAVGEIDEVERHRLEVADSVGIHTIEGSTPVVGTAITLASGALVTLNADGSLTYDTNNAFDYLAVGDAPVSDTINYEVIDGQGGVSTNSAVVTISPVNDAPVLDDGSITIGETDGAGTAVHDLDASDVDNDEGNGDFIYEIIAGDPDGIFGIDSTTGEITVASPELLDHETVPQYVLQVGVEDPGGASNDAFITVTVADRAEPAIHGSIFDDVDADGSVVSDNGLGGVQVHLYVGNGNGADGATYYTSTTTDGSGAYSFTELEDETYYVVVDSSSIASGSGYNTGHAPANSWAEQTYGSAGAVRRNGGPDILLASSGAWFGGSDSETSDDASDITSAEHINQVAISGSDITQVDFGFSFNVVTNVLDGSSSVAEQGSLRQFIDNANSVSGENRMRFVPGVGTNASGTSGGWWQLQINEALPAITDSGTTIDGQAYLSDMSLRDENATVFGDDLTADGTVGTGADGVAGTGDESLLLTDAGSHGTTAAGLDAPELEITSSGSIRYGLVIAPDDDRPSISDIEISNISIHGFGVDSDRGANIFVDASGLAADGITEKQISNVRLSGNFVGVGSADFSNPGSLSATTRSDNIAILEADNGFIFDNIVAFANDKGIELKGDGSALDGANDWEVVGNVIHGNAIQQTDFGGIDISRQSERLLAMSNLISGHNGQGIDTFRGGNSHVVSDNTISGNGFGNAETGGIRLFGESHIITHNVIAGNTGAGIHVIGANSGSSGDFDASRYSLISQNAFENNSGNAIDLSASLTFGQTFDALDADNDNELIGSEIPVAMQAILASIDPNTDNKLSKTEFIDASEAILLFGDGISENDGLTDVNSGNEGLDHVELARVGLDSSGLQISGTLDTTAGLDRIEIYLSNAGSGDTVSGTDYGEGSVYLGTLMTAELTIGPGGSFTGLLVPPSGVWPAGVTGLQSITTISIDTSNNTSEFSNNVVINQIPVAVSSSDTINEDSSLTLSRSHFGFTDQAGATMTHVTIEQLPSNGKLFLDDVEVIAIQIIDLNEVDLNLLEFRPDPDFHGQDSFRFRVFDGQHESKNVADVTIDISSVNDAPDGNGATLSVDEDSSIQLTANDFGFSDPAANENDDFKEVIIRSVAGSGVLTLNGLPVSDDDTIPVAQIPNLVFTPDPDRNGQATIVFSVVDDGGNDTGGQDTDPSDETITINIDPVNDPPAITSGDISIPENQTSVMTLTGSDIDSDSLTFSLKDSGGDNDLFEIDPATDELRFRSPPVFFPVGDANRDGVYEVTVTVDDGNGESATKLILVTITDTLEEAPVFGAPELFPVPENSSPLMQIAIATDNDGDPITYTMEGVDAGLFDFDPATRTLTFKASPDFESPLDLNGDNAYEVLIRATDDTGLSSLQTVTIEVQPENDNAPAITFPASFNIDENTSNVGQVIATDADLPLQNITYSTGGGLDEEFFTIDSSTGQLQFKSGPDFENPLDAGAKNVYRVNVVATDQFGLSTDQLVRVTVDDVDDLPTASADLYVVNEGENYWTRISVLINDIDRAGGGLTVSLVTGPDVGELTLLADGSFNYVHDGNDETGNKYEFVYEVTDVLGQTSQATAVLFINPVNDAPVAVDDGVFDTDSGETMVISRQQLTGNDSDRDHPDNNNRLAVRITGSSPGGSTTVNASGNIVFQSDPDFSGEVEIRYVAVDENGAESNEAVVRVNVLPGAVVNPNPDPEPPTTDPDPEPTNEEPDVDPGSTAGNSGMENNEPSIDTIPDGALVRDNTADTVEPTASDRESVNEALKFELGNLDSSYSYSKESSVVIAGLNDAFDSRNATITASAGLSTFDPSTMVAYWGELDSATNEFMMNINANTPTIVASVTSLFTVGYLAWIIRGGVLLTTFMSSKMAWQSFDPLPVIEQGVYDDDGDDQSIEEMVE